MLTLTMNAERTPVQQPTRIREEPCQLRHPSSVDNVMHIPLALSTRRRKSVVKKVPIPAPKSIRFSATPRAVLGIIQIATDLVMDTEGSLLVAQLQGVEIRHTKVAFREEEICTKTYEQAYADGAIQAAVSSLRWPQKNLQGEDYVTVWGMSCTSISFILGQEKVQSCFPDGANVTDMWTAVLRALRRLGAKKLAVLTPYQEEVSSKNEQLLEAEGFELCGTMSLGLTRDVETSAVAPEFIEECVTQLATVGEPDVVFIGCSAFRACTPGFITNLEAKLGGVAVVTSTQAFLWHVLRIAGIEDSLDGYGKLFKEC